MSAVSLLDGGANCAKEAASQQFIRNVMGRISHCGSSAVNLGITSCQLVHTVPKRVFSGLLSIHSVFRNSSDDNRLIVVEKSKLCRSQEQVFIV